MINYLLRHIYFSSIFFDYLIRIGSALYDYLVSFSIIIESLVAIRIFEFIILRQLKIWIEKKKIVVGSFIILSIEKFFIPILYFYAFYFGFTYLNLNPLVTNISHSVIVVVVTYFIVRFIIALTNYVFKYYWEKRFGAEESVRNLKGISTIVNIVLWGLGIVFLLDNLEFKVSAILAGLGVGGVAVAFAAQAVLGDFFSYFIIFFDRPFQIGDFIAVDNKMGTVESIGVKTTRILSVDGEEIVFPNALLTNSRIHNYKNMVKKRMLFRIGMPSQTPLQKLKEIPGIIKNIIEGVDGTMFERVHFQSYGYVGLIFEISYYITGASIPKHMDIQQIINFRIYEEFESRGIERPVLLKLYS